MWMVTKAAPPGSPSMPAHSEFPCAPDVTTMES
jgi:hypothetical protein